MAEGDAIAGVVMWVTEVGLTGSSEAPLLRGFCERASAAGLPLGRAVPQLVPADSANLPCILFEKRQRPLVHWARAEAVDCPPEHALVSAVGA